MTTSSLSPLHRSQTEHEFFALTPSGEWLFNVGSSVLILESDDQKSQALDKLVDHLDQTTPHPALMALMEAMLPLGLIYLSYRSLSRRFKKSPPQPNLSELFAHEIATYRHSSKARFELAKSGNVIDVLRIRGWISWFFLIVGLCLLIGSYLIAGSNSSSSELLDRYFMEMSVVTAFCILFGGWGAWYSQKTIRALAEEDKSVAS